MNDEVGHFHTREGRMIILRVLAVVAAFVLLLVGLGD